MTIKTSGVSADAAQEPVGQQVDPGDPNYERLQAIYLESRDLNKAETVENAWRSFKINREMCSGDLVIICPPGRRRMAPRTNPNHLDQIYYPNDTCYGCGKKLIPPESPQGVEQHFYEGQEHIHTSRLYHPACWDTVYRAAVKQGAKALDALLLWKYLPPIRETPVAPPKPARAQKRKVKAAANPTKPRRQKAAVRHRAVPTAAIKEKFKKVPRRITEAFLLTPELKVDFGVPSTGVKAEIDRILVHKLSRVFATEHHCRDGTIRGTYTVMRQEYLAGLIAKGKAAQPAPTPLVKTMPPPTIMAETPGEPVGWADWFLSKLPKSPSMHP